MSLTFLLLAVGFLAYSNGANDNFKGVASLFGSGTIGYRRALTWATATTLAGSLLSLALAETLLQTFSGKGLVPDQVVASESFRLAVALGTGATVMLATLTGLPISTTHALTGAIAGSGLIAVGAGLEVGVLRRQFLLPLLLSPVAAVALGATIYLLFRYLRLRLGIAKEWCVCVGIEERLVALPQPNSVFSAQRLPALTVAADTLTRCSERYTGAVFGVSCQRAMDAAHVLSAGAVSFARGLNDTPKIATLLLVAPAFGIPQSVGLVALAIAAGGLLSARRVAETMSHRITAMNHGQGFAANLATALLVIGATGIGLPVSTTHVSVGALFGIGLTTRQARLPVIVGILVSWLVTLPCAAVLGGLAYWLITNF